LRLLLVALGGWGLIILSCLPATARTTHDIHAAHDVHGGNCVAYARDVTGVHLDGNAAAWWPHAEGRYERGHNPEVGAILVFKAAGRMHVGHVAVVSRVIGPREVLVDQANWVRGRVTKSMSVVDASPLNDWTSVKVQYGGTHGRDNPTYGFIYPHTVPAAFEQTLATAEAGKPRDTHADRLAANTRHRKTAPDEEVAAYRQASPRHLAERAKPHPRGNETQVASAPDPTPQQIAEHVTHQKKQPARAEAKIDAAPPAHAVARAEPHEDAGEQEAAAEPDPVPQHPAEHEVRRKTHPARDEAKANASAQPAQQLAAAKLPVHKQKLPDARLVYVY
jgi:surface antigen